ncbi:MAG TPA: choline dehydrogenase, partial [Propionibacteriaceae bacterium]|nr:choline dehydrogenase [Propionibacteriaceae bacterium]
VSMGEAYDYIVVGAGTAGCVLAGRLSEDPGSSVLLVEAGGSDRSLIIAMPGALPFVYQNSKIGWGYRSGPEPYLGGKTIDEKAGKVIGGSSSINAMIFNRGNPMDYEGWANDGLTNWDFAHVLPYFRKMESFADGPDEWRGGSGPVHITRCQAAHPLFETFVRGGEQAGFPVTTDHNGYQQEGVHIAQAFIDHGLRWSAPRAYLRPAAHRSNLTVLANTTVNRIVVIGGVAEGIEIENSRGSGSRFIGCHREVIVCAGAMKTPQLLMLSGIGPGDELRRHDIKVVAEAPGVGRNLQNHPGVDVQFGTAFEDSLTAQLTVPRRALIAAEWLLRRKGLGASNFFEAGAFLRTRDDVGFPNMQYEFLPLTRRLIKGKLVPIPGFQVWMDLSRPESRGSVTLRSANPADAPLTVFNHLESPQDMTDMIDGVRLMREQLLRQPVWEKYQAKELNPGPDISSDSEIEAFIRANTGTSYHASGTCRMGADEESVVDPEGRMRVVGNIRVADASIMPKVVTANINAPVLMMAEKIADAVRGVPALRPSTATFYTRARQKQGRPSEPAATPVPDRAIPQNQRAQNPGH